MIDKDPNSLLSVIYAILDAFPVEIKAAILAGFISFLRIMYDNKEPSFVRRFLESCLCGAITVATSYLIQAIGLQEGWSMFLGGMIGLFGADYIRTKARKFAEARLQKLNE